MWLCYRIVPTPHFNVRPKYAIGNTKLLFIPLGLILPIRELCGVNYADHEYFESDFEDRKDLKLADKPYTHIPLDVRFSLLI